MASLKANQTLIKTSRRGKQMFQDSLFGDSSQPREAFGKCLSWARWQVMQRPYGLAIGSVYRLDWVVQETLI